MAQVGWRIDLVEISTGFVYWSKYYFTRPGFKSAFRYHMKHHCPPHPTVSNLEIRAYRADIEWSPC